jgi:hypothetical protein
MANSTAFFPIQRLVPANEVIRIDEVTERFQANRKFNDLRVLVRRVPRREQPSRQLKLITDTSVQERRQVFAESAMDASKSLARMQIRPKDTRRQNQGA